MVVSYILLYQKKITKKPNFSLNNIPFIENIIMQIPFLIFKLSPRHLGDLSRVLRSLLGMGEPLLLHGAFLPLASWLAGEIPKEGHPM